MEHGEGSAAPRHSHLATRTNSGFVIPEADGARNTMPNSRTEGTGGTQTTASGLVIPEASNLTHNVTMSNNDATPQQNISREKDHDIPIASMNRIIRGVLPPNGKISDDAKEAIQECVLEFINLVTKEANEKCHQESRRILSPDDIISAMRKLGFSNHADYLSLFHDRLREQDPGHNPSGSEPISGYPVNFVPPMVGLPYYAQGMPPMHGQGYVRPPTGNRQPPQDGVGQSSSSSAPFNFPGPWSPSQFK